MTAPSLRFRSGQLLSTAAQLCSYVTTPPPNPLISIERRVFGGDEVEEIRSLFPKASGRLSGNSQLASLSQTILLRVGYSTEMSLLHALSFYKCSKLSWATPLHQDYALPAKHRSDDPIWTAPTFKAGRAYMRAPQAILQHCINIRIALSYPTPGDIYFARTPADDDPTRPELYPGDALQFSPLTFHGSRSMGSWSGERFSLQFLYTPKSLAEKHDLLPLVA